jgi:hypothetical protein
MTLQHQIDLSTVPHRPGQSTDLEPKRLRAWERLTAPERKQVIAAYSAPVSGWAAPFSAFGGSYERVLFVLASSRARLSPNQVSYLLVARWYHNVDPETVRVRLSVMVRRGHARWTKDGQYYATDAGIEHLRTFERSWLERTRPRPAPRPQGPLGEAVRRDPAGNQPASRPAARHRSGSSVPPQR